MIRNTTSKTNRTPDIATSAEVDAKRTSSLRTPDLPSGVTDKADAGRPLSPAEQERAERRAAGRKLSTLDANALQAAQAFGGGLLRVKGDSREALDLLRSYQPNTVRALESLLAEVPVGLPMRPLVERTARQRLKAIGLEPDMTALILGELGIDLEEAPVREAPVGNAAWNRLTMVERSKFLESYPAGRSLGTATASADEVIRELQRAPQVLSASPEIGRAHV